jgi:hypothetical protein
MSALYSQMAAHWWWGLTPDQQRHWLDRAETDGRARNMLSAYTLMGDLQERDDTGPDLDEGR